MAYSFTWRICIPTHTQRPSAIHVVARSSRQTSKTIHTHTLNHKRCSFKQAHSRTFLLGGTIQRIVTLTQAFLDYKCSTQTLVAPQLGLTRTAR